MRKHNSNNSWSWRENVYNKSLQGSGITKTSDQIANTPKQQEQDQKASEHTHKQDLIEQNEVNEQNLSEFGMSTLDTMPKRKNEYFLNDFVQVWNNGRKLVHAVTGLVAYKLNCYNDKPEKWIVKFNNEYKACVKSINDVLSVFVSVSEGI